MIPFGLLVDKDYTAADAAVVVTSGCQVSTAGPAPFWSVHQFCHCSHLNECKLLPGRWWLEQSSRSGLWVMSYSSVSRMSCFLNRASKAALNAVRSVFEPSGKASYQIRAWDVK